MKTQHGILTLCVASLFAAAIRADDATGDPPARTTDDEAPPIAIAAPPTSPLESGRRVGPPPRPFGPPSESDFKEGAVLRWLDRLREAHPEEFARMRHLRETQPEKFREEMRRRIQRRLLIEEGGSPFAKAEEGGPRREAKPPPRLERDPEMERLERELVALVREFHSTDAPERREEIQRRIRNLIREAMERREAVWAARVRQMRRELTDLEERLDRWRENRDATIEQRLQMMLEKTPQPPPEPPPPPPAA